LDIDGEQWQNPPSIGADQFTLNATGPINMGINTKNIRVIAGYEANFVAINEGLITTNVWDFGDGNLVTNQAYVTHRFAAAGTYVVRLTGYNNSNPDGTTTEVCG
jgi:PKD repeat protein